MSTKPPIEELVKNVIDGLSRILEDGLASVRDSTGHQFNYCLLIYDDEGEVRALAKCPETKQLVKHLEYFKERFINPEYLKDSVLLQMPSPTNTLQ